MKTDDLIRTLAADTARRAPLRTTLMVWLPPALVAAGMAVWLGLGFRDDLAAAMTRPAPAARFVLAALLGVVALRLSLLLARPEGGRLARFGPLVAVAGAAVGLLVWAFVTTPAPLRPAALMGQTMAACLLTVPLLSILPVAVLHHVLRRGAVTAPRQAGFVAGLAGGGLSAAIYALHCPENSPLFYVTWNGLAIAGVAITSALIARRSLRW